jgi:predicted dehydrogenase
MSKVRWGILSTAKIGLDKVIPGMQKGLHCEIAAIASRNIDSANAAATRLGISKAYGSYEELLTDPDIDAIYIPVPNHMHISWAIKALEANKHVLCEKPIGLSSAEALDLLKASHAKPQLKVMEAFMYRFHPQWKKSKQMVVEGRIGKLKTVQSFFSYNNVNPDNIRNKPEMGGGGMMDIGCYCVSLSRFIFNTEPKRLQAFVEFDPVLKTDRMASGILDFTTGTATFTCSTQLAPYQRVNILGDMGRIEIEIPFNALPDKQVRIWLHTGLGTEEIIIEACDQYTIQGELFSKAIIDNTAVPTPLEDAVNNMRVIETIFKSAETGRWVECG